MENLEILFYDEKFLQKKNEKSKANLRSKWG